jgi:hypothetical protein
LTGRERGYSLVEMSETDSLQKEVKKIGKKDILSASDLGGVLEAYRGSLENSRDYEIPDLQLTVADKLHELGEEDKSFEFTILASQTVNADKTKKSVDIFADVIDNFILKGGGLAGVSEEFRSTGDRISNAASEMSDAAMRIQQSSNR